MAISNTSPPSDQITMNRPPARDCVRISAWRPMHGRADRGRHGRGFGGIPPEIRHDGLVISEPAPKRCGITRGSSPTNECFMGQIDVVLNRCGSAYQSPAP